jgi:hypothetical protein
MAAQAFFHKGHPDAKQFCQGTLGAQPSLVGVDDLLT